MTRVILAPKERLTLFDLRTQTFRVNMVLFTYYNNHAQKIVKNNCFDVTIMQKHVTSKQFFCSKIQ